MNNNLAKHPSEYAAWASMKTRCNNPNVRNFADYGGRGISVCARWSESFTNFLQDMGPRPRGYSLERKSNNGNYCPENCRWASRMDQNNNRRNNRLVSYKGQTMSLAQAIRAEGCQLKYSTVSRRIFKGWDLMRSLTEPLVDGENLRLRQQFGAQKANNHRYSKI